MPEPNLSPAPEPSPKALVRVIGRWSLTALMVNSIIGAGIFGLPSLLAAQTGGLSPISCLVAGLGVFIIAACIAEVSSQFDETGGLYLYARHAFGVFPSLLVAWLTLLTRIVAPAAGANLFCTYAAQFFPVLAGRKAVLFLLAVLIGHLALFNYIGVKTGKNVSNFFTVVKVGFLLFFVVSGLFIWFLRPELRASPSFAPVPATQWFQSILLLIFAYGGFEGTLFVGGETKNPRADTPVALLCAMAAVCVIYTAVQFVVVNLLPSAVTSARPLADAAQRFLGTAGGTTIGLAALISTYGLMSANLLQSPRITFAMGERGDFPRFFAAVHPRFRTPYISIVLYAVMLFGFAALGSFRWNVMLSAVARLAVYGAMALAVPVLRRKNPSAAGFRLPFPYLFSGAGGFLAVLLMTKMGCGEFLIVAGTCLVAFANWLVVRNRRAELSVAG
ncbi:MAG: APC family permease [Candidatus Acidiferrum sp.]